MNMPAQSLEIPIWIIDDDQSMRWVLDKTLTNNGYRVNAFESGSVALATFKRTAPEERPALIITDVRMPGINGFELLKQIKHISPVRHDTFILTIIKCKIIQIGCIIMAFCKLLEEN